MNTEEVMMKFPITRKAWIQAGTVFSGIAIPCYKTTANGGLVRSEKVLKFNRSDLKRIAKESSPKADPRLVGGEDRMRFKVGKPGSPERLAALAEQYASLAEEEISPFVGD